MICTQYPSSITRRHMAGLPADDSHRRTTGNMSIRSKYYKSKAHKQASRVRNENNHRLRAELHAKKCNASMQDRDVIQREIDAIGGK